jgi:hypothetical protein
MNIESYNIVISQEVLRSAIVEVDVSGKTEMTWTGLTYLLSGGTNGDSVLTGLTIPVLFKETYKDIGYYSGFDGAIYQKDINNNFIYSATTDFPYDLYLYNTSNQVLQDIIYNVDWGDGQPVETITNFNDVPTKHSYPIQEKNYVVSMSGTAAWGTTVTKKNITVPYSEITFTNPKGEYFFVPRNGYWSGTPISYDYIFTGDSVNTVQAQISANYVTIPFLVTGYTTSRLNELRLYGPTPFIPGVPVISKGQLVGVVNNLGPSYTGYTYQNTDYFDFPNGITLSIENSSGLTENNIKAIPLIKEENLIGMVNAAEVQSDVFIDRGKLSGSEGLLRLGEVDNLGDLIKYGYGYFKIKEQ